MVSEEFTCFPQPCEGDRLFAGCPFPVGVRWGGNIERDQDIAPDRLLELKRLAIRDRHITVNRELE
jgi:hypothetical protein